VGERPVTGRDADAAGRPGRWCCTRQCGRAGPETRLGATLAPGLPARRIPAAIAGPKQGGGVLRGGVRPQAETANGRACRAPATDPIRLSLAAVEAAA